MALNNDINTMLNVIELIYGQRLEMTSKQLAKQCNTEESLIFPILVKLTNRGWLCFDPVLKLYKRGLGLLIFTKEERLRVELIRQSNHIIQMLSKECNQTVMLSAIDCFSAICIHKIEPKNAIYIKARVGRESPLHAGSSGRVLLAYAPDNLLEAVLSRPLKKFTPLTITSKKNLRKSLSEIKKIGYCYSIEEVDPGAAAISCPILNNSKNIIASLSVIGTRFAFEKEFLLWKEMLLLAKNEIDCLIRD